MLKNHCMENCSMTFAVSFYGLQNVCDVTSICLCAQALGWMCNTIHTKVYHYLHVITEFCSKNSFEMVEMVEMVDFNNWKRWILKSISIWELFPRIYLSMTNIIRPKVFGLIYYCKWCVNIAYSAIPTKQHILLIIFV